MLGRRSLLVGSCACCAFGTLASSTSPGSPAPPAFTMRTFDAVLSARGEWAVRELRAWTGAADPDLLLEALGVFLAPLDLRSFGILLLDQSVPSDVAIQAASELAREVHSPVAALLDCGGFEELVATARRLGICTVSTPTCAAALECLALPYLEGPGMGLDDEDKRTFAADRIGAVFEVDRARAPSPRMNLGATDTLIATFPPAHGLTVEEVGAASGALGSAITREAWTHLRALNGHQPGRPLRSFAICPNSKPLNP